MGAVLLLTAGIGSGHGATSKAEVRPSDLAPGPLKRRILDVQQRQRKGDHPPGLVKKPLAEAVRAAERARGARASGDKWHGSLLTKLGEQWAGVAEALLRAADAEGRAQKEADRLSALNTKVERAEALLAEQQARLGRLRAEVQQAEKKAAAEAEAAAESETKRLDQAAKRKRGGKRDKPRKEGR